MANEGTDTGEESLRVEREQQRVAGRSAAETSTDSEKHGRVKTGTRPQVLAEMTAPGIGLRPGGETERTTNYRTVDAQVEQAVLKTPLEESIAQPKPTDRVTLKFTDDAGVEGRLRVALRGQSVRATIVSGDQATAERLGARVSELQHTLDKQGFKDPQITVQQARASEEAGNVAIASTVRSGQETVASSTAGRTLEEQASRERQQPSTRDQQQQHSGRSQQRSRERQER
jgi:hypothetical protein